MFDPFQKLPINFSKSNRKYISKTLMSVHFDNNTSLCDNVSVGKSNLKSNNFRPMTPKAGANPQAKVSKSLSPKNRSRTGKMTLT